jgi:hypothetical protein
MPYQFGMHTVVETPTYIAAAKAAGMTEKERTPAVDIVAAAPEARDMIAGSGGARKIRVPREGGGKSGGYRVVTYFMTENEPVFLLTVLSKTKAANFSPEQKHAAKAAAKQIRDAKR